MVAIFPVSIAQPHINRAHPARIIHIISKGGDEGSGPQDCSLGQALRLQFPVEVSDLYGRLSTHVATYRAKVRESFNSALASASDDPLRAFLTTPRSSSGT